MIENQGKISKPPRKKWDIYARTITGLSLGGIMLLCLYYGNESTVSLFLIITILGAVELGRMTDATISRLSTYTHVFLAAVPMVLMHVLNVDGSLYFALLVLSCLIMTFMILNLWMTSNIPYTKWRFVLTPLYWGLPFGLVVDYLKDSHEYAFLAILGIFLILWTSDIMAYFSGRLFGKHKLFPSVSPGKTVEGSLGAGVFSIIISIIYAQVLDQSYMKWVLIALIVWVFGTLGDLVESKMKRTQGVKDSGNMLPGHGGFLDRFDSLVMVIPFVLLIEYLTRG